MARVKPFRGVRYSGNDLSSVVSQPYDRIGHDLQDKYYDLSPYNVVRIICAKALPTDLPDAPAGPNVYTRARADYGQWVGEGVLVCEAEPALYVYHQRFTVDGEPRTRRACIAALELSEFTEGIVLPHERTHAGPKLDRLRLLRALDVNTGLVFMLYPDPQNRIAEMLEAAIVGREPDASGTDLLESDVQQQMWVVSDPAVIHAVQAEMSPKRNLIIADGHHRYETALTYREEMQRAHRHAPPDAAFNYCMVSLVSLDDPGLVILPTHREVFDYPQVSGSDVLTRAESAFHIIPAFDLVACLAQMRAYRSNHAFGLYADGAFHVLVLRDLDLIEQQMAGEHSWTCRSLDVSILHKLLLEDAVGLTDHTAEMQAHIRYHRDPSPAIQNVDAGVGSLVFFLNPTWVDQVKACASEGAKMPQKSTDFYPKMISGLTLMPVGVQERI